MEATWRRGARALVGLGAASLDKTSIEIDPDAWVGV
jgi:hypothetical protein